MPRNFPPPPPPLPVLDVGPMPAGHRAGPTCWCAPREVEVLSGRNMIVHRIAGIPLDAALDDLLARQRETS